MSAISDEIIELMIDIKKLMRHNRSETRRIREAKARIQYYKIKTEEIAIGMDSFRFRDIPVLAEKKASYSGNEYQLIQSLIILATDELQRLSSKEVT